MVQSYIKRLLRTIKALQRVIRIPKVKLRVLQIYTR